MRSIHVAVIDGFEQAEPLWRAAEETADLHIYQRFDWLHDWHRLVGATQGVQPCFVVLEDTSRQPLALLPLAIERRGPWRVLTWMGAEFFDYHTPLLMPDAWLTFRDIGTEAVWDLIRPHLEKVDYADFERQPALIEGQPNPFHHLSSLPCTQSAHHTRLLGDWSSYYAEKRGRRTRHNDRRKRKKLENEGQLNFVVAESPDQIDRIITAMIRQKEDYAEAIGKTNLLEKSGYASFLKEKAKVGLGDGSIIVCSLELDGEILAAQWGAVHQKRLYSIVASYADGPHNRLSPGDHLLRDLMSWCFDHGIEIFDFTYGDEPYKLAWCEHHVTLYRSLLPITVWGKVKTSVLRSQILLRHRMKRSAWIKGTYVKARKLIYRTSMS